MLSSTSCTNSGFFPLACSTEGNKETHQNDGGQGEKLEFDWATPTQHFREITGSSCNLWWWLCFSFFAHFALIWLSCMTVVYHFYKLISNLGWYRKCFCDNQDMQHNNICWQNLETPYPFIVDQCIGAADNNYFNKREDSRKTHTYTQT